MVSYGIGKLTFDYYDKDEFFAFLNKLPDKDAAKLATTIREIEEYGLLIAERQLWVKKIDVNLFEIRSQLGSNIQRAIYFHIENNRYVITHGFTKKVQKTPVKEIRRAKMRRQKMLERRRSHESD